MAAPAKVGSFSIQNKFDEPSLSMQEKQSLIDLPQIRTTPIKYPRHVVSGTTIDAIADKNMNQIKDLKGDRESLREELKEVRALNEKLFARVDYLEDIIKKEASANTYFYDYPPKPDKSLKRVDKTARKEAAAESEAAKVKELYTNQMEMLKRKFEGEMNQTKLSAANEIEQITEVAARTSR